MEEKQKYFTLTTLKTRGWTDKTIKNLLKEPLEKTNPYYKKAASMKLYLIEDVLEQEKTSDFIDSKNKKEKRQIGAKKAVETKRNKLIEEIKKCKISVQLIENPKELIEKTIKHKAEWYCGVYSGLNFEVPTDKQTLKRWQINYIRHELTEYDDYCQVLFKRVGKDEGYNLLKSKVMAEIKKKYPYLFK